MSGLVRQHRKWLRYLSTKTAKTMRENNQFSKKSLKQENIPFDLCLQGLLETEIKVKVR
jgi:hypothetical protein